ncbi:MAG: hypothetical protein JW817_06235 [Clostridiales bacterium]|nr:hypothetical protein [Clostridiales bacterium]
MSKKTRIFVLILATGIILSACNIRGVKAPEKKDSRETSATETIPAVTSTLTPTPTPTSEPTPTSTPSPTPSPTPIHETVDIPREELPEGQLFDEKYYAVLPGEGAMFNVYDCYGIIIHSFTFNDGESLPPIGLFEIYEIEQFTHIPANKTESQSPENRRNFPGGYYEWPSWEADPSETGEILRIVTNKGNTIIIKNEEVEWPSAEWNRTSYPDATEICVMERIYLNNYNDVNVRLRYIKIGNDGTVLQNFSLEDLPFSPVQIVGDKYAIVSNYNNYNEPCSYLMDYSGNIILEDVTPINTSYIGWLSQSGVSYSINEYFIWNGKTFDAELKIVPDETRTPDGLLIPGVRYDVDGILCQIEPRVDWYSLDRDTFAVGTDGTSKIAIKSIWGDCVIRDVDAKTVSVLDVSPTMVFLSDYSLYSLRTGEFIRNANIEGRSIEMDFREYRLTDRYLIISYKTSDWHPVQLYERFYIFDEYGNLRYYSSKSQAGPARDDLILLKRGPYIGIADLNGDWVLKTVDPGVKRDAEELTYW